jgi:hypothetical protein
MQIAIHVIRSPRRDVSNAYHKTKCRQYETKLKVAHNQNTVIFTDVAGYAHLQIESR